MHCSPSVNRFRAITLWNFLLLNLTNMVIRHFIREKPTRFISHLPFAVYSLYTNRFEVYLLSHPLYLSFFRSTMGIFKLLMAVQHFSVEIDLHMSKNMRLRSVWESVFLCNAILLHPHCFLACLQVEFNKAAQSLTDPATILTVQKRNALNRLIKVIF